MSVRTDKNIKLVWFFVKSISQGLILQIILQNWNLSQANIGFCDDVESW